MTLWMSLLSRTQLPWILFHQTTLSLDEKVNHPMNTVRNPTLAITWLSYKINSGNCRTYMPSWNLPPTHM